MTRACASGCLLGSALALLVACGGSPSSTPTAAKASEPSPAAPEPTKPEPTKPEPTKAEPAPSPRVHPRLDVAPAPDLAVVVTEAGVVALDPTGKTVGVLSSEDVEWCRVDPRAGVLWTLRPSGGDDTGASRSLTVLDLESDAPPITVLERAPQTIVIAYPDEELGREEDHLFDDGVVVHMSEPPRVEAILGCDGDMFWSCFDDEDDIDEARAARLAKQRTVLGEQPMSAATLAALAPFLARSKTRRATLPDPGRAPAPRTVAVPVADCHETPEDCGQATVLTGTRFWRVIVGNSRGDFYHEDFQLYDPKIEEFFDPTDPAMRSKTPLSESSELMPEWISPSGALALASGTLVRLEGGVVARELAGTCGFWGGGWEI